MPSTAVYALLAAAYSLVYGLIGRINFAFGELAAAGGYGAALGARHGRGAPPAFVLPSALRVRGAGRGELGRRAAAGCFCRCTAPPARSLVATVGLAIFLSELLRLTQGARPNWVRPILNAPFGLARAGDFIVTTSADALLSAALALAAAAALVTLMRAAGSAANGAPTPTTRSPRSCSASIPNAMFLRDIRAGERLAGLAGFVMTMFYGAVGYDAAATLGLKALVAAILGGIGSVPGALIGGLMLGGFEALWSSAFPIDYRDVAVFRVLAIVLTLRPGGILGVRESGGG